MMRMLQESKGIAFVEERRPALRTPGRDAAELRTMLMKLVSTRGKRVLRVEMKGPVGTEESVKIIHVGSEFGTASRETV